MSRPNPPVETADNFWGGVPSDPPSKADGPVEPVRMTDGDIAREIVDKIVKPPSEPVSDKNLSDLPDDFSFKTATGRAFDDVIDNFKDSLHFSRQLLWILIHSLFVCLSIMCLSVTYDTYHQATLATDSLWRRPLVWLGLLRSNVAPVSELITLLALMAGMMFVGFFCFFKVFTNAFSLLLMIKYYLGFRYTMYTSLVGQAYMYRVSYRGFVSNDNTFDARPDGHKQGELKHKNPQLAIVDVITTRITSGPNWPVTVEERKTLTMSVTLLNQLSSLKCFSTTGDLATGYRAIELFIKNSSTVNVPQKELAKLNFIHSDTAYIAQLMLSYHRGGEVLPTLVATADPSIR